MALTPGFLYNMITNSYTTLDEPMGTNGSGAFGISGNNIVGTYSDATGSHRLHCHPHTRTIHPRPIERGCCTARE